MIFNAQLERHLGIGAAVANDLRVGSGSAHYLQIALRYLDVKAHRYLLERYKARMETPGDRLKAARVKAGYETIAAAAHSKRFHPQNLADHESGRRRLGADQAVKYARAFKVSPQWLLFGSDDVEDPSELYARIETHEKPVRLIRIRGEVRVGTWIEMAEEERIEGEIPVSLPAYARSDLFALRVAEKSMDGRYPEGTVLIVCPFMQAGVREGDDVIMRRVRNGLAETTLSEVSLREDGVIVIQQRSPNKAHQEPLPLDDGPNPDDRFSMMGVVVASFLAKERNGPLLYPR